MGLFDKFKKNSKNVKKENEKINTSSGNLFDEKPKDALTNNMNFDEKLGTYVIEIKGIIFESGTEQGDTYISSLDKIIYVFLTIFLYLLKCPQSLILSALRAFCFCGKPHISRSIFLYFRYQAWLKSW